MNKYVYAWVILGVLIFAGTVHAELFSFRGTGDLVEITENFGDILPALTSGHFSTLESVSLTTQSGSTDANQYIRFGETSTDLAEPYISYTKSDDGDVGLFLFIDSGSSDTSAFFEYELEFEQGLKSKIDDDNKLKDFDNLEIPLFADDYLIIDAEVNTNSKEVELILASSAISDIMEEGSKKIFSIGSKKYEVEVVLIESGTKDVKLSVNGQQLSTLSEGEFTQLPSGVFIGVVNALIAGGNAPDLVKIFLGANILTFRDDDYSDSKFERDVEVNKASLSEAYVKISGSASGDVFSIADIKYRLITPTEIFVASGETLRPKLKNPLGMLGNWDVKFVGTSVVQEFPIKFDANGQTDYSMTFQNLDGDTYTIPFISLNPSFKLGSSTRDLVVLEAANTTNFIIDTNDYFVLSTGSSRTDKTYILSYDSIDTGSKTLFFDDPASGSKSVTYTDSNITGVLGQATLSVGSISATVHIENASGNSLAIDQDADGNFEGDAMDIIARGGAVIDLGTSNSISSPYELTITTEAPDLEESTSGIAVVFDFTGDTSVGIDSSSFTGITLSTHSDQRSGMTQYGAEFILTNIDSGSPEELTINYPIQQRFADVTMELLESAQDATSVETVTTSTCANGVLDGDETDVDCGGSCPPCEVVEPTNDLCTNGVLDGDETDVDCGGSCPPCVGGGETTGNPLLGGKCQSGCLHVGENEVVTCLEVGDTIGELYCSVEKKLQKLKKNSAACIDNFECRAGSCEEGKCGKKIGKISLVLNILLLLLVLFIIYYATAMVQE